MISDFTFNAIAKPLLLTKAKKIKLVPTKDSPVELLNKAGMTPLLYSGKVTDEEFFAQLPNELKIGAILGESKEVSFVGTNGVSATMVPVSEHEMTLSELVKMATGRVDQLFNFSRNIVQPFVKQVLENFNQPAEVQIAEDWHLSPVAIDVALINPVVSGLLSQSADPHRLPHEFEPVNYSKVPADLPVPKTGSQAYDGILNQLLEINKTTPAELMTELFAGQDISPYRPQAFTIVSRRIAQLLLVAYYEENPWPDSGVTSSAWSAMLSLLRTTLKGWIARFIRQLDERVKLGQLVYDMDPKTRVVHICQELMDEYVKQGGCAEAVYGALYLQDDNKDASTNINKLLENQEQYVAAWSRRSSVKKAAIDTDWLSTNKTAMKNAFMSAITAMEDGMLDGLTKQNAIKGAYAEIDSRFNRQISDITAFIIRVACHKVFVDEAAERIVQAIHRGMCDNVEPDEAARDEMTEYVLDWILSGIAVE